MFVLNNKDKRFFELARKVSKKSNHHTYKIGCVIVKNKNIVGIGYNQLKTHPKSKHAWSMIHAEIHAVIGAEPSDLRNSTVYVFREHKDGTLAIAKPCKCCDNMLRGCNVKRILYTTNNNDVECYNIC